jgi:serine protease Do
MLRRYLLSALLVVCGLAAGLVLSGRLHPMEETAAEPLPAPASVEKAAPAQERAAQAPTSAGVPDFSGIASRAVKSVVNVSSLQVVRSQRSPFMNDPFFRQFFGDEFDQDQRSMSLGSGVIISPDGYVVTNNHVVGEDSRGLVNREINAVLPDKREVRGRLIATDPMTDIALLKIDVHDLPVVPWGDSSKLKVGQWVLAIGSPFQLNQTVTLGIVSAVGRTNLGVAGYEDFIQTDAAINPGNSGGALVDAEGRLVGINTAIYSESGGYQGIGFAVPSSLAHKVVDDLLKYGEVRRGSIGAMQLTNMTPELAEQLGVRTTHGALVYAVSPAAYQAGIRRYDIITSFNGQTIDDYSELTRLVADARVGTTATLGVIRDDRTVQLKVPVVQGTRTTRRQGIY